MQESRKLYGMNNLSDMHVHIDYFKNYKQIYNSFEINKTYALFVTNLPEIFQKCLNEFADSKFVKLGLGYNPQLVETYPFYQNWFGSMLPLTKYVGEVGLDYSKEFVHTKVAQKKAFDYICYQSARSKSILSIHSRGAEHDVLTMLKKNGVEHAIFHWYSGKKEDVHKGFEIIKSIPVDRLLIETDAPFGKTYIKDNSYNLPEIYNQFSKKLGIEQFEQIVFQNLKTLLTKHKESLK